jgi:hypothetical protein
MRFYTLSRRKEGELVLAIVSPLSRRPYLIVVYLIWGILATNLPGIEEEYGNA